MRSKIDIKTKKQTKKERKKHRNFKQPYLKD